MVRTALLVGLLIVSARLTAAQPPARLLGAPCTASATEQVTESKTGRTYLLDYPCDLKPGEPVTFILNLHGGGSSGTWQRRYFPALDYKEQHRLVIASPYSPTRRWTENDDSYLQNIVTAIVDQVGRKNVRAFWLAGHSQGGATSRRLVCTDFFKSKVDGFLSLSGGRLGGAAERAPGAGRPAQAGATSSGAAPAAGRGSAPAPAPAAAEPSCDFSHIYSTGEHEIVSLPTASALARRYNCSAPVRQEDVVDTKPGYVHDGGSQKPGTKQWGLLPRPGHAQVVVYPGCSNGRTIADVVRIDKGHTEGLEPLVTEALVKLMLSARGGKVQGGG